MSYDFTFILNMLGLYYLTLTNSNKLIITYEYDLNDMNLLSPVSKSWWLASILSSYLKQLLTSWNAQVT